MLGPVSRRTTGQFSDKSTRSIPEHLSHQFRVSVESGPVQCGNAELFVAFTGHPAENASAIAHIFSRVRGARKPAQQLRRRFVRNTWILAQQVPNVGGIIQPPEL